jgi:hypothetical protein
MHDFSRFATDVFFNYVYSFSALRHFKKVDGRTTIGEVGRVRGIGQDSDGQQMRRSWPVSAARRTQIRSATRKIIADCFFGLGGHRSDFRYMAWWHKPVLAPSDSEMLMR